MNGEAYEGSGTSLFDENFCVVGSTGFIVGVTIHVTSGALVGSEGQIGARRKRSLRWNIFSVFWSVL